MYYWRRLGASVIDMSVISMFSRLILSLFLPILALSFENLAQDFFKILVYQLLCITIAVGYNLICYKYFKYPLGKLLLSIKVFDENQRRVPSDRYLTREIYKYVYIYATLGLYIPYQFLFNVCRRKQTFHDKKAQTHIFM